MVAKLRTVVTFGLVSERFLVVSRRTVFTFEVGKSDERRGERATLQPWPQRFECRPGGVVLVHGYSRDYLHILPGVLEELIYWPNCAMQSSRLEACEGFCVTVAPWTLRWLCDWLQAAISASFRLGFS